MNSKFIGGVLLIVGTSIGGGMLALPIANAAMGFWPSTLFLLVCWVLMTWGAFYILEVNYYLPPGKNMVSMAAATLGRPGLIVAWLSYLFLLYTLLSAYISGGADVMGGLLQNWNIEVHEWKLATLFTLVFGLIVYGGIYQVDLLNRLLMFGKLAIYGLLIVLIAPYIKPSSFREGNILYFTHALMLLVTSFGFAIIVPNLRTYFNNDIKTLKKVILVGSLIPLFCYIAWDAVIMGALDPDTLKGLINNAHTTSSLATELAHTINNSVISRCFNFFTSICMLTAFLGVSLCLISFLSDGLKFKQSGREGSLLFIITFLPPLLAVICFPGAYIHALNYAGFLCVILLLLLPASMSFFGRRHYRSIYHVPGGKIGPILLVLCSTMLMSLLCI